MNLTLNGRSEEQVCGLSGWCFCPRPLRHKLHTVLWLDKKAFLSVLKHVATSPPLHFFLSSLRRGRCCFEPQPSATSGDCCCFCSSLKPDTSIKNSATTSSHMPAELCSLTMIILRSIEVDIWQALIHFYREIFIAFCTFLYKSLQLDGGGPFVFVFYLCSCTLC